VVNIQRRMQIKSSEVYYLVCIRSTTAGYICSTDTTKYPSAFRPNSLALIIRGFERECVIHLVKGMIV